MTFYVETLDRTSVINSALAQLLDKKLNFQAKNCIKTDGPPMEVNVFEVTFEEAVTLSKSIWKKSIYFHKSAGQSSNDVQPFDVLLTKTIPI